MGCHFLGGYSAFNAEVRPPSWAGTRQCYLGRSGSGAGLSPSTTVFRCIPAPFHHTHSHLYTTFITISGRRLWTFPKEMFFRISESTGQRIIVHFFIVFKGLITSQEHGLWRCSGEVLRCSGDQGWQNPRGGKMDCKLIILTWKNYLHEILNYWAK
jgi:hypothetical protein